MNTQVKVGDIVGYAADAKAGRPVRPIRIAAVYASGTLVGRLLDGDYLLNNLRIDEIVSIKA